jgi:hypothetical protein
VSFAAKALLQGAKDGYVMIEHLVSRVTFRAASENLLVLNKDLARSMNNREFPLT